MAQVSFDLDKGISIGEHRHVECVLREATVGDLTKAARAAEVVVLAPTGRQGANGEIHEPCVLINPYLMEMHTLRQQVERLGELTGPLEDVYWNKLSETDIAIIKANADLLSSAQTAPAEVVLRGRTDEQRQVGGDGDQPAGAADKLDTQGSASTQ